MIQTVLGSMDEQGLGYTLAHEHMLLLNAQMRFAVPEWFNEETYFARTLPRIERLRKAGVDAVIDATPLNLGRDARVLAELSRRSGLRRGCIFLKTRSSVRRIRSGWRSCSSARSTWACRGRRSARARSNARRMRRA